MTLSDDADTPAGPSALSLELTGLALAGESPDTLLERALESSADLAGAPLTAFFSSRGEHFVLQAGTGWPAGAVGGASVQAGPRSPLGTAASEGAAVVVEDLVGDRRFDSSELFDEAGAASGIFTPVRTRGTPAVLAVLDRRARPATLDEVTGLERLAEALALPYDYARLHAGLRRSEARTAMALDTMDKIAAAPSLDAAVSVALGELRDHLGWPLAFALRREDDVFARCGAWSATGGDRFDSIRAAFEAPRRVDAGGALARMAVARHAFWVDLAQLVDPGWVACRSVGLRGFLCVPAVLDGRVEMTLCLLCERGGAPGQAMLDVCDTVARQLAARLDHVRQDAMIRESEARFRGLFEAAELGVATIDLEGRIEQANPALCEMLGHSREALVGRRFTDFASSEEEAAHRALYLALLDGSISRFDVEHHYRRRGRDTIGVHMVIGVVRDTSGRPLHGIGMALDVSERNRLRGAVADASRREQERIGRALHDDLAQLLTGAILLGDSLVRRLQKAAAPDAETAAELASTLHQARDSLRTIAFDLGPVSPHAGGFEGALDALARRLDAPPGPPACRVVYEGGLSVADDVAYRLYRVAQAAARDAVQHSGASEVVVTARRVADGIELRVEDDGRASAAAGPRRLDLALLRYEAALAGGRVVVEMTADGGRAVRCTVSL